MSDGIRLRRPPPPLRQARVAAVEARSPRLQRITLEGPALVGLDPATPASSVRLLVPRDGELVVPTWNGNEFLHDDGRRPDLRTLTPMRIDAVAGEVDVDIVLHGSGPVASWAAVAREGEAVALSGTGRGYVVDPDAPAHLLAGDESAVPAITTVLAALPADADVRVLVEIAHPDAVLELEGPSGLEVSWHPAAADAPPGEALVDAVVASAIAPGTRVWAAGEAASMQRLRRHLFDERELPRPQCTVRGYWKHGRAGGDD